MAGSRGLFWKPGTAPVNGCDVACSYLPPRVGEAAPRIQNERAAELEENFVQFNANTAYSLSQQRARLPIFKVTLGDYLHALLFCFCFSDSLADGQHRVRYLLTSTVS
jgi:hypothetical protein